MTDTDKAFPASHSVSPRDWARIRRAAEFTEPGFVLEAELPSECFERCQPASDASEPIVGIDGVVWGRIESQAGLARGSGRAPAAGRAGFTVEVNARIRLNCQSCGVHYEQQVASETTLWVARDMAELDRWEQGKDVSAAVAADRPVAEVLLAEESFSALQIVEDELLLNLPYVPRCPACRDSDSPRRIELF